MEKTLNHLNNLKLKICSGDNVMDCCAVILVDAEHIDSFEAFKNENLGYIANIF